MFLTEQPHSNEDILLHMYIFAFLIFLSSNHRITESAELEGPHKDHRIQLLEIKYLYLVTLCNDKFRKEL